MLPAPRFAAFALVLGLALLAAPEAQADDDSSFLYPQLGLGTGHATVAGRRSTAVSLDLTFGNEWEVAGLIGSGFIIGFDIESASGEVARGWRRFSLTSLWSLTLGYRNPWPFLRVGAGPALSLTTIDPDRAVRTGGGLTLEVATGFRSVVELYGQSSVVFDSAGAASSFTVGFRLNAWVFEALFGIGSGGDGGGHRPRIHRSRPRAPHRAVPVGA